MLIHTPKDLAMFAISQRKRLKLSQAAVANLVGLKQQTISAFENKPESTKIGTVFQILAAIKLDIKLLPKDKNPLTVSEWKEEW